MGRVVILIVVVVLCCTTSTAQRRIDLDAYEDYKKSRKGMTTDGLLQEYPAGKFASAMPTNPMDADFFDAIRTTYSLTPGEIGLLSKNSFMVSERLSFDNYFRAYHDVYVKDLPVYISSDALLHAFHRTYSNALRDIERTALRTAIRSALDSIHATILKEDNLERQGLSIQARRDVDVYIAVAQALVRGLNETSPVKGANKGLADSVLQLVLEGRPAELTAFTKKPRLFDFSQMEPRGYYSRDTTLQRYFRTMMWIGRIEMVITPPQNVNSPMSSSDVLRQNAMAIDLARLIQKCRADTNISKVDNFLTMFIGEQDNITTQRLIDIIDSGNLTPESVSDTAVQRQFQEAVVAAGGGQQILSQLLGSGDTVVIPSAAFMPLGQRFIFDSYILGNVVFDKTRSKRMMPSPLDALFVLGNDATAHLLIPEIDRYQYAENLAALRYLTNTFDDSFWTSSLYTSWLGSIRDLNPPADRSTLPRFMRTAAWWQKTINTQLTSWAELRHDNILVGKQSHTVMAISCFYPKGFVEPVPALYRRLASAAAQFSEVVRSLEGQHRPDTITSVLRAIQKSLANSFYVNSLLAEISEKELRGIALTSEESTLIDTWIINKEPIRGGCATHYNGRYSGLLYGVSTEMVVRPPDFIVADVHTQPTDEEGYDVGKILHVGTGRINMAAVIAEDASDGCAVAYVGPVGSYYESVTEKYERLTDQDWAATIKDSKHSRPQWTWLYLADTGGARRDADAMSLLTSVSDQLITVGSLSVAPNPSSGSVLITVPAEFHATGGYVTISDVQGRILQRMDIPSFAALPTVEWTGTDATGNSVSSGQYVITIVSQQGTRSQTVAIRR